MPNTPKRKDMEGLALFIPTKTQKETSRLDLGLLQQITKILTICGSKSTSWLL